MPGLASFRRSFPTVALVLAPFRWISKTRRRLLSSIFVLVAIIASPPLWWAAQLWSLPDIGDPFDVAAFEASTVPDDRNAFVLYEKATALLKPSSSYLAKSKGKIDWLARWSQAHPDLRRWAEDNRAALGVYRQGAERPDAFDRTAAFELVRKSTFGELFSLHFIVLLEASRLEEQGDMAGAWELYRALLRTIHHVGMHADVSRRQLIVRWYQQLLPRLTEWTANPKTSPALMRKAISDVVACEALAPSELDSLKAGYCGAIRLLDSPHNPGHEVPLGNFRRFWHPEFQLTPEQIHALWDWWRFLQREPERSRRVLRLVTANWLAYFSLPASQRPKPDPRVAALDVYEFGPGSPGQARALPTEALDGWFNSAYDAQKLLRILDARGVSVLEAENHAQLLIMLATEIYRRDHGADPPTADALVGPYLERVPAQISDNKRN
jgi:hypothetical protein